MVIDRIRNLIKGVNTSDSNEYSQIITNLSLDINTDKDDIELIKKAFDIGYAAHKGQLRKSGEEYFNHCALVGLELSKWNMDRDVVISGLLHDTLEDTNLTREDIQLHFNKDICSFFISVKYFSGNLS